MGSLHLTGAQVLQIRRLRADGLSAPQVARIVGCSDGTVRKIVPGYIGKVPVAPLREAFLASGKTAVAVAKAAGWFCSNGVSEYPDSSRVKRTLGLLPDVNGKGIQSRRTLVDAELAAILAEAVGVMPWEVMPDEQQAA